MPAYRAASAVNTAVTPGAALAITAPVGSAVRDLVLAQIVEVSGAVPTAPAPSAGVGVWAMLNTEQAQGTVGISYWWKIAGTAEPATYTFSSAGAGFMGGNMSAYTGGLLKVSSSAVGQGTAATNFVASSLNMLRANGLLVCYFSAQTVGAGWTAPGGMTEQFDNTGIAIDTEAIAAAGATGTRTGVAASAENATWLIAAIEDYGLDEDYDLWLPQRKLQGSTY